MKTERRLLYVIWIVGTVFSLTFSDFSVAQELKPHEGFKGVRWGASIEEMLKVFTNAYEKDRDIGTPREKRYFVGSNVGKAHVDLSLIFLDEKFACARMFFEPREFSEVVDVFTARYGKPSINTLSTVAWVIAGTTVTASSNGAATVASREYAVYLDERRREHLKDAAKGL